MAHIHEKIDFTASIYIVKDGKVLLHKHVDMVYFARPISGTVQSEEEGGEINWFDEHMLLENEKGIRDGVRSYALAAVRHFEIK